MPRTSRGSATRCGSRACAKSGFDSILKARRCWPNETANPAHPAPNSPMKNQPLNLPVAILAGGLASRLRPLTEKIPKALVPVAGQPFLARQLELLRRQGLHQVVLCVGYLGELIQDQFGDGRRWGVKVEYSFDGPAPLGTGGALKQALSLLGGTFFTLYGDSYLPIDFKPVAAFFQRSGKRGLMTVYENRGRYDASNVWFADGEIKAYTKANRLPQMRHIDYGLSLLTASAFADWPAGAAFDLAAVLERLLAQKQLAGFEVHERFYEIGSPSGLAELAAMLARPKTGPQRL